jgi:cytochrome c-type biogenesis protein CcmH
VKYSLIAICSFILIAFATWIHAADIPLTFSSQEEEQRFTDLIKELRCLVCQNQSLADSNADLAQDLREEIYNEMLEGKSNNEIIDYLVARYGDFVLYRPPLKPATYLLWTGPVLFLLIGVFIAVNFFTRRKKIELSQEDQQYANELLREGPEEQNNT